MYAMLTASMSLQTNAGAAAALPPVGFMPMPLNFRHADVLRRGRPRHGMPGKVSTYDSFYIKHPPMSCGQRAKIFAPFDALAGFSACIAAKQVVYEEKRILTDGEREELDRKLSVLMGLTANSRMARENSIKIQVTRYVPCDDPENEAYGKRGRYETVTGILRKIDVIRKQILLNNEAIPIGDIVEIQDVPENRVFGGLVEEAC